MDLETQIQSLITSFVYGMYLSLAYNIVYKYLYSDKILIKIIANLIFTITHSIIYFIFMKLINEGIIHVYFVILLIIGFIIGNKKTKSVRTISKKQKEI